MKTEGRKNNDTPNTAVGDKAGRSGHEASSGSRVVPPPNVFVGLMHIYNNDFTIYEDVTNMIV